MKNKTIVIIGVLLSYMPSFFWMWDRWFATDSYYSHGILIPFVCAYLIWLKKKELAKIPHQSSPWGMGFMISGILVHLLSSVLRVYFLSLYSLLLVIIGFILFFYGSKVLRTVLFPVLFLSFMMPLPLFVVVNLSFNMKLFAADIAKDALHNMGFAVQRVGSTIRMEHVSIVVEDVCSGLRSLISLTALASVFAYWMKGSAIKKAIVFISAIPIAILTNVCRIVFISFASEVWGPKYVIGFVHDLSGLLIFVLAFGMLYMLVRLIE